MQSLLRFWVLVGCLLTRALFAQDSATSQALALQAVKAWETTEDQLLEAAFGDLNQDGLLDAAAVFSHNKTKRVVIVFFGSPAGLTLVGKNANLVFDYDSDENFPESLSGLRIEPGRLLIDQYGGFSLRWGNQIAFTFAKKGNNLFFEQEETEFIPTSDPEKVQRRTLVTAKDTGMVCWIDYARRFQPR